MTSVFVFVSGATLLVLSAEKLITHLVGAASGLRIPLFLLAVVFTGVEFDDIALGVGLNLEDLSGVALGVVFGTALSFTGVVLAVAAVVRPSTVDIPRDYLVLFAAAPLVVVAVTLAGPLTVTDGLLLPGLFVLFVTYVAARELRRSVAVFRDVEVYEAAVGRLVSSGAPAEAARVGLSQLGLLPAEAARQPVTELSAGQRRRLDLAVALAARPHVVLMDEPTNHLSMSLVEELTEALGAARAAVVMATHDRQLLRDTSSWPRLSL